MIFLIIIASLLLTLLNIYLVIKIWQFRTKMAAISYNLVNYEFDLKSQLTKTTQILNQQQVNIKYARQEYQLVKLKLRKIRQYLILLSWLYRISRKYL